MAPKPPKIPKELYVTVKAQQHSTYHPEDGTVTFTDDTPLGFLHGHGTGSTFDKKRQTQLDWAYSGSLKQLEDGRWQTSGQEWIRDPISGRGVNTRYERLVPVELSPAVWKNDPMEGFIILNSVSRYSTSNKLWRIMDPRGIQFEISTGCFQEIIMTTSIVKGLIMGPCVWVGNKNLIVAP